MYKVLEMLQILINYKKITFYHQTTVYCNTDNWIIFLREQFSGTACSTWKGPAVHCSMTRNTPIVNVMHYALSIMLLLVNWAHSMYTAVNKCCLPMMQSKTVIALYAVNWYMHIKDHFQGISATNHKQWVESDELR